MQYEYLSTYDMLLRGAGSSHRKRSRLHLIERGPWHHLDWYVVHAWGDLLMRRTRKNKPSRGDRWGRWLGISWHLAMECLKTLALLYLFRISKWFKHWSFFTFSFPENDRQTEVNGPKQRSSPGLPYFHLSFDPDVWNSSNLRKV